MKVNLWCIVKTVEWQNGQDIMNVYTTPRRNSNLNIQAYFLSLLPILKTPNTVPFFHYEGTG